MSASRMPLASRPSPTVTAALRARAIAAGIDPAGPVFAAWAGDLISDAVVVRIAERLAVERLDTSVQPIPNRHLESP